MLGSPQPALPLAHVRNLQSNNGKWHGGHRPVRTQGGSGGDIQICDAGVRNVVEIPDQCTEAVSVGHNQDRLSILHQRCDMLVPAGQESLDSILQAIRCWELFLEKVRIARIVVRMS